LETDIKNSVFQSIADKKLAGLMGDYFKVCTEEIASDIMGLLTMGPAFVVSVMGFLKAMRPNGRLSCKGYFYPRSTGSKISLHVPSHNLFIQKVAKRDLSLHKDKGLLGDTIPYQRFRFLKDNHHLDILRPYVLSAVIALFAKDVLNKNDWIDQIEKICNADFEHSEKENYCLFEHFDDNSPPQLQPPIEVGKDNAIAAAKAAGTAAARALFSHNTSPTTSLIDLFPWTKEDEFFVNDIRQRLNQDKSINLGPLEREGKPGSVTIAGPQHILAAAVLESTSPKSDLEKIFTAAKKYLAKEYKKF
jgi:hypothetical protein